MILCGRSDTGPQGLPGMNSKMAATLPMFRKAMAFAAALALAGCAGQPPRPEVTQPNPSMQAAEPPAQVQAMEYQRIIAELRRASECVSTIEAKSEYAPLRAKSPGGGAHDNPYPTQYMDKSKATAAHGKLILAFLDEMQPCQPNFGALVVHAHQNITRMILETWAQQQDLYRHLKEGVITWGVFNQGTRSNADKLSGGLQALRLTNEG